MKSSALGKNTFPVDLNITKFGIWLCLTDKEFFLPYDNYPFFKSSKLEDIYDVELLHETHLHWPTLDIDLDIEILENPQHFPLVDQVKTKTKN